MANADQPPRLNAEPRLTHDELFKVAIDGEGFSVLQPGDPSPEQLSAADNETYKLLAAEVHGRKTMMRALQQEVKKARAELKLAKEELKKAKVPRLTDAQKLRDLHKERMEEYEGKGGLITMEELDAIYARGGDLYATARAAAEASGRQSGFGFFDDTIAELRRRAERRKD